MTDFQNCKKYFIRWCTTLTLTNYNNNKEKKSVAHTVIALYTTAIRLIQVNDGNKK